MYDFLQALPAVLGVSAFFAYLWAGQARIGGELFKKIVDKLRLDPNLKILDYERLSPAKVKHLVDSDTNVRNAVNEGDRDLLRLLAILQTLLTLAVLIVCAALVGLSVWLYLRPKPLSVGPVALVSTEPAAAGWFVDLDPVDVQWKAAGAEERVGVYLENVESGKRGERKAIMSSERSVTFQAQDYYAALSRRYSGELNRLRAVIESSKGTFMSGAMDFHVGIEVALMFNGKLMGPEGERSIHTLFATIDHSTDNVPKDYCFTGDLVGWDATSRSTPIVESLRSCVADGEVRPASLSKLDWHRSVRFVYNAPDNPRIVRSRVEGGPSPEREP